MMAAFAMIVPMIAALKGGAQMKIGCDHPEYLAQQGEIEPVTLASLVGDLG